ncbi:hypothetical protein UFOVP116_273 [uncultured Caudovirales phage]|uniref:Uncharacterized protein n=1 Tax=uncultured Caudovirales phage TaxID=2100421 RepID=A0A6J5LAP3_9CAUD|nr:hypothetical protein UFOVP116_273 [uncultured Caudovirales phage]
MINNCDKTIVDLIKPSIAIGPWIAGGAAMCWFQGGHLHAPRHDNLIQDIDVFFANDEQLSEVRHRLCQHNYSTAPAFISKNAETFTFRSVEDFNTSGSFSKEEVWKVQLIKRKFYTSVHEVLENFDFVCCSIATDGKQFVSLPNTAKDLNARVLNVNKYNPETSLPRTLKYWAYGFEPSAELIDKIAQDENININFAGYSDYDGT